MTQPPHHAADLGFGSYRVGLADPEHEKALRKALDEGVVCIDTSSNYGDGKSEELIGRVLSAGSAPLRLVTKVGYVQGQLLEQLKAMEAMSDEPPDIVKLGDSLWHCIHPEFLELVVESSMQRLFPAGRPTSGPELVVLLHNPEYFLQHAQQQGTDLATARHFLYHRLRMAFGWLESEARRGRISSYGVSSNTFASPPEAFDFVSLEECVRAAHDAIDGRHHFGVAQMPMNLIEHFPATVLNQDGGRCTTLERAQELGIRVLINRPLNAIVDRDLIRLVSHQMPSHIVHPSDGERRMHELEVVEHDLANALLAESGGASDDRQRELVGEAYRVAGSLCQAWSSFQGLIHWRDVRRQYLDPRLEAAAMLSERSERMSDHLAYISDVVRVLDDLDVLYARDENASLEELRDSMTSIFALDPETPLQHVALHALRCTAGVSTVLVGMRRMEYVDDVLHVLDLPEARYNRTTWNRAADELRRLSEEPS
ncbi:MAG: aldo/keto reductase [Bacteroidota bacterium]